MYIDHLALTLSLNTLHHTTRVTYSNRVGRDVARNHRACTYDGTISNGNSRQNRYVSPKPHILSNGDRAIVEDSTQTLRRVDSVVGAYKAASRTDECAMADGYDIAIEECAIHINKGRTLEVDILTHQTLKSRLHKEIFVVTLDKFAQNRRRRGDEGMV